MTVRYLLSKFDCMYVQLRTLYHSEYGWVIEAMGCNFNVYCSVNQLNVLFLCRGL